MEQTLSIVKPDATEKNIIGEVLACFEKAGLKIVAAKMLKLTKARAEQFYAVHKEKPFYTDLVNFMTSGPVMVIVLQGDHCVEKARKVMGATDFKKAEPGTIRAKFATNIERNAVHGSDSLENARKEIDCFFKKEEIILA
jgi:nucleoside-diphosphate kinase